MLSRQFIGSFLPLVFIPSDAIPSFIIAFSLFFASIYSTTSKKSLFLFRLALAPVTIYYFYDFGYGPYWTQTRGVEAGIATVSVYGIMRVLETTFTSLVEKKLPYWITDGKPVPVPTTFVDRVAYSFDLATSLRGTSWFPATHWNWAPKSVLNTPNQLMSRAQFVVTGFMSLIGQYLIIDIVDTIIKSRTWHSLEPYPVSGLPIPAQLVFTVCLCLQTFLAIIFPYTFISTITVLLGSNPNGWPPMFDAPFTATSLADFWARRWHAIFRRVFARLSRLVLHILPLHSRLVRAVVIFTLSALLHIMVMDRVHKDSKTIGERPRSLLDQATFVFFWLQPLGLVIEAFLIVPLGNKLLPVRLRTEVGRAWAWLFLIFSGRYWADVWVRNGLWDKTEKVVGYSVIRGVKDGEWML